MDMKSIFLESDDDGPDASDYEWMVERNPRASGVYCEGCKSASAKSPIEAANCLEVDRGIVGGTQQVIAHSAACEAARELDVDPPEIRWFWPRDNASKARGWFLEEVPRVVWLKATLRGRELERIVRHETAHYADFKKGRPVSEQRAESFEEIPRFEQPIIRVTQKTTRVHIGGNY